MQYTSHINQNIFLHKTFNSNLFDIIDIICYNQELHPEGFRKYLASTRVFDVPFGRFKEFITIYYKIEPWKLSNFTRVYTIEHFYNEHHYSIPYSLKYLFKRSAPQTQCNVLLLKDFPPQYSHYAIPIQRAQHK